MSTNAHVDFPELIYRLIFDELVPPFGCAVRNGPLLRSCAGGNGWAHPHRDIEAAARVCQRWRRLALKRSKIWAYIAIPGTCRPHLSVDGEPWWTWAEVLRQRSKEEPLVMCLDLQYVGEGMKGCQVIQDCLPRIKELCIHGSGLSMDQPILDVLKRNHAPRMEKFSLDLGRTRRLVKCDFQPGELFCGSAPALRCLTVKPGIRVVLPLVLSRLTRYAVLHRVSERTNGYDLHAQLSLMTSLEVLEIESDTHHELDWENREKILLKELSKIVIKDSCHNCKQLLSKITPGRPASCRVEEVAL